MSVSVVIVPFIIPILIASEKDYSTSNRRMPAPYVHPKIASRFNSEISKDHMQLVYNALQRIESLHGIPISRWDKDFLNIKVQNYSLVLEIPDVEKTTLRTRENIDDFLRLLDIETKKLVQDKLYSDITAKAESKGLELQAESVEDDDTIVLTFRVP